MTNYIDDMADDDRRKNEEKQRQANESGRIQATKHIWIQELMTTVERHADHANQRFYNGGKAFEVRTDVGLYDERSKDFVVMTADLPAAYLYVYADAYNRTLTRRLVTVRDMNTRSRQEQTLPPLQISMNGNNPVFHDGAQTMDIEGVARLLLEPVIRAHRET